MAFGGASQGITLEGDTSCHVSVGESGIKYSVRRIFCVGLDPRVNTSERIFRCCSKRLTDRGNPMAHLTSKQRKYMGALVVPVVGKAYLEDGSISITRFVG